MAKKKKEDLFISDSGLLVDQNFKKVTFFVVSCRLASVILVILGIMALIEGNL